MGQALTIEIEGVLAFDEEEKVLPWRFQCVGMIIYDSDGKYPVYALRKEGEEEVAKNGLKIFSNIIQDLEYGNSQISLAFRDPIRALLGESYSEALVT